jgi:predicted transcriptional regulator
MNSLKQTRKAKGLTQRDLSERTGIVQSHISEIETGTFKANLSTRRKIEAVLGKVDWLETTVIRYCNNNSHYKAEQLVYKLIETTSLMDDVQKADINRLIHKYFK